MLYGTIFVAGLVISLIAAGMTYRAYCQNRNAGSLRLDTPLSVNEEMYVSIGGIDQWLQIRGENRNNPVILVLHGGPGFSYVPFTPAFQSWEKHYTVVQWDQRGAGRTFGKNGKGRSGALTIERMAEDGLEVAGFLQRHLKKEKIILFAHSWGTILGIPMIAKRPELFSAYIGTGQIANMSRNEVASYSLIMDQVRASTDQSALKTLESIGAPPYKDLKTWMIKARMAVMFAPPSASGRQLPNMFGTALTTPGYSLKDGYDLFAAFDFSSTQLYTEMMTYDAAQYGTEFKVPIIIIQGDNDLQAPTKLAKEYFDSIKAPKKDYVNLKGEGHTAVLVLGDVFLTELLTRVGR